MHVRSLLRHSTLVGAITVSAICGAQVQAPNEGRLKQRIAEVHAAIGGNDVERWYSMLPPSVRARMSFEDFKRDIRWEARGGANQAPTPMQAEIGRVCSCKEGWSSTRCVISARVAIEDPRKGRQIDMPLESWEYDRGDWYLGYIGASTEGRCPGEPRN